MILHMDDVWNFGLFHSVSNYLPSNTVHHLIRLKPSKSNYSVPASAYFLFNQTQTDTGTNYFPA
jgi:hypothetical protein